MASLPCGALSVALWLTPCDRSGRVPPARTPRTSPRRRRAWAQDPRRPARARVVGPTRGHGRGHPPCRGTSRTLGPKPTDHALGVQSKVCAGGLALSGTDNTTTINMLGIETEGKCVNGFSIVFYIIPSVSVSLTFEIQDRKLSPFLMQSCSTAFPFPYRIRNRRALVVRERKPKHIPGDPVIVEF